MKIVPYLLFVFLTTFVGALSGQTITEYTVENTSTTVRSSMFESIKDSMNREWFISDRKIDCKVGNTWYHFNHDSIGFIYYIAASADSSIWFTTNSHVFRMDKNRILSVYRNSEYFSSNRISNFLVKNNQVVVVLSNDENCDWFADQKLFFFHNNHWVEKNIGCAEYVHQEENGSVWFSNWDEIINVSATHQKTYSGKNVGALRFDFIAQNNDRWFHNYTGHRIKVEADTAILYTETSHSQEYGLYTTNAVQTPNGFIYAASPYRIAAYNGTSWQLFNVAGNTYETGIITIGDSILYWSQRQLIRWFQGNERIIDIPFEYSEAWFDIEHNTAFVINYHNNKLYKLTELLKWEEQQANLQSYSDPGMFVFFRNGLTSILRHHVNSRRYTFNGISWVMNPHYEPNGIDQHTVYSITEDPASNVWIVSRNGVHGFINNSEWINIPFSNAVDDTCTYFDIAVDDQNNIWLASSMGLQQYDGHQWHIYNRDSPLNTSDVYEVHVDNRRNIWLSTRIGKRHATFLGDSLAFAPLDNVISNSNSNVFAIDSDGDVFTVDMAPPVVVVRRFNGFQWFPTTLSVDVPFGTFASYEVSIDKENILWLRPKMANGAGTAVYKRINNTLVKQTQHTDVHSSLGFDKNNMPWYWNNIESQMQTSNSQILLPIESYAPEMMLSIQNIIWIENRGKCVYKIELDKQTTGIEEETFTAPKNITLYPVPSTDKLFVDSEIESAIISITNTMGTEVAREIYSRGNSIQISSLSAGIYHLHFIHNDRISVTSFCKY